MLPTPLHTMPACMHTEGEGVAKTICTPHISRLIGKWSGVWLPSVRLAWFHHKAFSIEDAPVQEYHLTVLRGNGETDFCLGCVAQWLVYWYSSHRSWVRYRTEISSFSFPLSLSAPQSFPLIFLIPPISLCFVNISLSTFSVLHAYSYTLNSVYQTFACTSLVSRLFPSQAY